MCYDTAGYGLGASAGAGAGRAYVGGSGSGARQARSAVRACNDQKLEERSAEHSASTHAAKQAQNGNMHARPK
eukprot:3773082-Pleurochrysis_carterae.AAC.1